MPTVLKKLTPIARKEHRCDYCGGIIKKGTRYHRDTLIYDDKPYDWCNHPECAEITNSLKMWDWIGYEGLTSDAFCDCVWEYMHDNYADKMSDEEFDNLSTHDAVLKILEELKNERQRINSPLQSKDMVK